MEFVEIMKRLEAMHCKLTNEYSSHEPTCIEYRKDQTALEYAIKALNKSAMDSINNK